MVDVRKVGAHLQFMDQNLEPSKPKLSFRFGNDLQPSLEFIDIHLPIVDVMVISEGVDVTNVNVQFLAQLGLLNKYEMVVNNVQELFECHFSGSTIFLIRSNGHICLEWQKNHNKHYTYSDLGKWQKNVFNPSSDKLFNPRKLAHPLETNSSTTEVLEDIVRRCGAWQWLRSGSLCFRVSLPIEDNIFFGHKLSINIMFLDGDVILRIVDTATRFSEGTFFG